MPNETTGERSLERRLSTVDERVESLLGQLTLDEKVSLLHADGKFVVNAIERLGIHEMWMSDGPHGVRYEINRDDWDPAGWDNDVGSYLPPTTMVAASWNTDMAWLHGKVLGADTRCRDEQSREQDRAENTNGPGPSDPAPEASRVGPAHSSTTT